MVRRIALLLLLIPQSVRAQDRLALGVFLGGALADDVTTFHNMRGGFREADPLYAFVQDKPQGVLLSLIVTDVVTLWLAHRYTPTHPRIVKIVLFTLGGIRIGDSVHNVLAWNAYVQRPVFIPDPH